MSNEAPTPGSAWQSGQPAQSPIVPAASYYAPVTPETPGTYTPSVNASASMAPMAFPPADAAIATWGLTKTFGQKVAVNGLNLVVRRGEFFGFLGPNGAGKSTTIKMMVGLQRPTSGTAFIGG